MQMEPNSPGPKDPDNNQKIVTFAVVSSIIIVILLIWKVKKCKRKKCNKRSTYDSDWSMRDEFARLQKQQSQIMTRIYQDV